MAAPGLSESGGVSVRCEAVRMDKRKAIAQHRGEVAEADEDYYCAQSQQGGSDTDDRPVVRRDVAAERGDSRAAGGEVEELAGGCVKFRAIGKDGYVEHADCRDRGGDGHGRDYQCRPWDVESVCIG